MKNVSNHLYHILITWQTIDLLPYSNVSNAIHDRRKIHYATNDNTDLSIKLFQYNFGRQFFSLKCSFSANCLPAWLPSHLRMSNGGPGWEGLCRCPCGVDNAIVEMYHAHTHIARARNMSSGSSLCWILETVVSRIDASMSDVDLVINWGPPKDLIQHCQEVDQAGRGWRTSIPVTCHYPSLEVRGRTQF